MPSSAGPVYRRILLKMSGGVLVGDGHYAIDPIVLDRVASDISAVYRLGVQVAIVVGGGNFFRGAALSNAGINRITGDQMGMLATLMNALALRDAFESTELPVRIFSAIEMTGIADPFDRRKVVHHLQQGCVVLLACGTGNPLVTTDSAASLRGIELDVDIVLKATNVDGVYSADPSRDPSAVLYKKLTFQEALDKELSIMDLAAFCQCRDYAMPLRVFNVRKPSALVRVVQGEDEGTLVQ